MVETIKAMAEGDIKVFIGLGGNFAVATPDTAYTQEALRKCNLTVRMATKLNRSHLVCGKDALILPCLGRTEIDEQLHGPQAITVEDSMSNVHLSAGRNTQFLKIFCLNPILWQEWLRPCCQRVRLNGNGTLKAMTAFVTQLPMCLMNSMILIYAFINPAVSI